MSIAKYKYLALNILLKLKFFYLNLILFLKCLSTLNYFNDISDLPIDTDLFTSFNTHNLNKQKL